MDNWRKFVGTYGNPASDVWVIQLSNEHDSSLLEKELSEAERALEDRKIFLISIEVRDWNNELSPWSAEAVFGSQGFNGGASETLRFVTDILLPEMKAEFAPDIEPVYILAGYSLAGLFALWSGYHTDIFTGVVAASPSVWFPGWIDFIADKMPKCDVIYLSLGNREEKTKNVALAGVGDAIRMQHKILSEKNVKCILEWNEGNHFKDSEIRLARGISWVVKNCFDLNILI